MKVWMLLAIVIAGGCASLSKEECRNADWSMIGFEDGSAGKPLNTIGRHREACARVDVTPRLSDYEVGHNKGLQHYCTAANGFTLGERGQTYNGICSGKAEASFLQAYQHGLAIFDLHTDIDKRLHDVKTLAGHLDETEGAILEHESALIRGDTTHHSRRSRVRALRELNEEKSRLLNDIDQTEQHIDAMRFELDQQIRTQRAMNYR